jgi:hypothetical protein
MGGGTQGFANGADSGALSRLFNYKAHEASTEDQRINMVLRAGQVIGGTGQVLLGGAICSGGITCAAGGLLALKGADNIQAGVRGADSVSQQLLVAATGSEQAGTRINAILDLSTSFIGLARSVPKISAFGTKYNTSWYKGSSDYFESSFRQLTTTALMIEGATSTTIIVDAMD